MVPNLLAGRLPPLDYPPGRWVTDPRGEEEQELIGKGSEAAAQARGLEVSGHRPWPLPPGPWVQGQTWRDLLFAHWPLPVEALRPAVPAQLPIDTFDGSAWLGVTPFEVRGARPRRLPPVPWLSRFAEVNVRTYVTLDGRPGIWFLSLDAASALAVAGARRSYRLPYFRARMTIERADGEIRYRSERAGGPPAELRARYRPHGPVFHTRPGTLEHFLTERYCLYTLEGDAVRRADIHHPPWPLQAATAELERNTMAAPYGIAPAGDPPLAHFAARQDVVIWAPQRRERSPRP